MDYDVIIVGGGPAGLSAGVYAVRRGLSTLLLEKGFVGGQLAAAPEIGNYAGFTSVTGAELAGRMEEHARAAGVVFVSSEVLRVELDGDVKRVSTQDNIYSAKAVILATGVSHRHLDVSGEEDFLGRGISYCATCDGPLFSGKKVAVIGGGNHACSDAEYLADLASKVYLVHRRDSFRAEECQVRNVKDKGVEFVLDSVVEGFAGKDFLQAIKLKNAKTGEKTVLEVDGAFISIGVVPLHALAGDMGVKVDEKGYIIVDDDQMTSIPGVYAAGDVTGGVLQVATAVGEGCVAALSAYEYIKKPYWSKKKQ
ncbi:MAG: FAD-dependent oxidoreductase [Candidatus Altiarchaeota archaeon]